MLPLFARYWFALAMLALLACGICWPKPLRPLAESSRITTSILVSVMFLTALPLETTMLSQAIRRPWGACIAVFVSLGLTPVVAWCLAWMFNDDLGHGLLVTATTPCSIVSAAVWTRRAGGNDALALVVIVVTNLACSIVTPAWLVALAGRELSSRHLSFTSLVTKLGLMVVLPMILAQGVRSYGKCGPWINKNKRKIHLLSQFGILSMVFIGAIQAGLRLSAQPMGAESALSHFLMAVVVLTLHLGMFWTGFYLSRWVRLSLADQFATGIAGSQKTLTVGIAVATTLHVSVLPMVAYHMLQLIVDTWIADRLAPGIEKERIEQERQLIEVQSEKGHAL